MAKKKTGKMGAGGQGALAEPPVAVSASPPPTPLPPPPPLSTSEIATQDRTQARQKTILEDQGHLRSDMKMMQALLRNPCYVPNQYFDEAASELMSLAMKPLVDDRVKVGAIKTVTEIAKLNLKTNEVAMNQAAGMGAGGPTVQVKVIVNMPDEKPQPKVIVADVRNAGGEGNT